MTWKEFKKIVREPLEGFHIIMIPEEEQELKRIVNEVPINVEKLCEKFEDFEYYEETLNYLYKRNLLSNEEWKKVIPYLKFYTAKRAAKKLEKELDFYVEEALSKLENEIKPYVDKYINKYGRAGKYCVWALEDKYPICLNKENYLEE